MPQPPEDPADASPADADADADAAPHARTRSYADVETELRAHPDVAECAVAMVETGPREAKLIAYVVSAGAARSEDLHSFLRGRLPLHRVPESVVKVRSLPHLADGRIDYEGLPRPVWRGVLPVAGKGSHATARPLPTLGVMAVPALIVAVVAFLLTDLLWQGSTDLSAVPGPWAGLFFLLYLVECLSFGLGVAFLLAGRSLVRGLGRPGRLTAMTHLAIVWLLAAWWPQDNFYRLAAKTDWPRQAALVYGFNITLMIAAAVLVLFVATGPARRPDDD